MLCSGFKLSVIGSLGMFPISLQLTVTRVVVVQARRELMMADLKILLSSCQVDKKGRRHLRHNKPAEHHEVVDVLKLCANTGAKLTAPPKSTC